MGLRDRLRKLEDRVGKTCGACEEAKAELVTRIVREAFGEEPAANNKEEVRCSGCGRPAKLSLEDVDRAVAKAEGR